MSIDPVIVDTLAPSFPEGNAEPARFAARSTMSPQWPRRRQMLQALQAGQGLRDPRGALRSVRSAQLPLADRTVDTRGVEA